MLFNPQKWVLHIKKKWYLNGYYSWTTLKMVKMALLEGQKLISNIDFKGHISTLQAENTPTSCICKEKKNQK